MSKKKKILRRLCIILAVLVLLTGAELLYSNYAITVSRYTVHSDKISNAFRVVFLSDLHGRSFGTENSRLLGKIEAEQPDLIFLVGDIFNSYADDAEIDAMCGFIAAATRIAPVYFSMGNHEVAYNRSHQQPLQERVSAAGAVVLDTQFVDLDFHGNALRLGGYMGYYHTPHMNTQDPVEQQYLSDFSAEFEKTDRYMILLNHIPTNWLDWDYRNHYKVDLVLSGHYHGGVVRIPFWEQGLIAPYVGWFPPYTKGLFEGEAAVCILTTGLAGYDRVPRFFNPPEICVADIMPKAQ